MNLAMREKVSSGEAIDLAAATRTPEGYYVLESFVPDMDYCDTSRDAWIWSIGRSRKGGDMLAATDTTFYNNLDYLCLFLR